MDTNKIICRHEHYKTLDNLYIARIEGEVTNKEYIREFAKLIGRKP
jgi:hypothetical protein